MKPVLIALVVVGAVGAGVCSFLLVRGAGGSRGGAATREGLVAATVAGVNSGDREALLDIMVGPASDRVAADCDNAQDSTALDQRRAERVDDALDEAKRRRMVLDHIGDDHAEVVLKKGYAIDKHCTARVDVVKHQMEILMHDGKDIAYKAQLVGMEIAGRWYLATIPQAAAVGDKPTVAAAPSTTPEAPAASPPVFNIKDVKPQCAAYLKQLEKLSTCAALPSDKRDGFVVVLHNMEETLVGARSWGDRGAALESTCQQSLDALVSAKLDCPT